MAFDVGRWLKYAQAKLSSTVASGHRELDELEAEREAKVADRPWLASDTESPSIDEARARIEWEAEEQRRRAEGSAAPSPAAAPASGDDAEVASARVELDRQARASKDRLEAIRKELGVDPAPPGGP